MLIGLCRNKTTINGIIFSLALIHKIVTAWEGGFSRESGRRNSSSGVQQQSFLGGIGEE